MQGHHIRVDLKLGVVRTRHFSWVVEIMYISRLRLGLYHLVPFYSFHSLLGFITVRYAIRITGCQYVSKYLRRVSVNMYRVRGRLCMSRCGVVRVYMT